MAAAWIGNIGMATPVGGCSAQTAASVRAGISACAESQVFNRRHEPMKLALLPEDILPPLADKVSSWQGATARQLRMLRIAHLALQEAVAVLPDDWNTPLPLYLAVPEKMPGHPGSVGGHFINHLADQAEVSLDLHRSRLVAAGRAAGFVALDLALKQLESGTGGVALLGGVDSSLDLLHLALMDADDRVAADGVMDGHVPGEGAGFLLLCSQQGLERLGLQPLVQLHAPGIGEEQGHRYSEETYTGDGLAGAVTLALQNAGQAPARTVISSINGESFGAKEWGVAYLRNQGRIDTEFRFEHPAECFGDTGAAAMPLLAGLAAIGLREGYLPGPVLGVCSSDGRYRGAVCISKSNS